MASWGRRLLVMCLRPPAIVRFALLTGMARPPPSDPPDTPGHCNHKSSRTSFFSDLQSIGTGVASPPKSMSRGPRGLYLRQDQTARSQTTPFWSKNTRICIDQDICIHAKFDLTLFSAFTACVAGAADDAAIGVSSFKSMAYLF